VLTVSSTIVLCIKTVALVFTKHYFYALHDHCLVQKVNPEIPITLATSSYTKIGYNLVFK
jgi:hypothetical protein